MSHSELTLTWMEVTDPNGRARMEMRWSVVPAEARAIPQAA